MVRDINYSVGKFSRGFNSLLTKAEIKHKIIVKVEILSPNTLHNVWQRNIVRKPLGTGALMLQVNIRHWNWGNIMSNADYKWFVSNYNELYKKYGDCYLVIKNKTVLGSFHSYADGVRAMLGKEELGTFIVQKCTSNTDGYTNYISSMNFI